MPVTPDDLLQYAKSLLSANNEAALRAAISRAYYACFHVFSSFAICHRHELPRFSYKSGRDTRSIEPYENPEFKAGVIHHGWIRPLLEKSTDRHTKEVGRKFHSIYTYRRQADYMLQSPISSSEAKTYLDEIEDVYKSLRTININSWPRNI